MRHFARCQILVYCKNQRDLFVFSEVQEHVDCGIKQKLPKRNGQIQSFTRGRQAYVTSGRRRVDLFMYQIPGVTFDAERAQVCLLQKAEVKGSKV